MANWKGMWLILLMCDVCKWIERAEIWLVSTLYSVWRNVLYEFSCGHSPTFIYYSGERIDSSYSLIIMQYNGESALLREISLSHYFL